MGDLYRPTVWHRPLGAAAPGGSSRSGPAGSGKGALRLELALILVQLLMATFVAITMMGWWFPGRTMVTVLPLFVTPIALVAARAPHWSKVSVALLGTYSLAITAGLTAAARAGEVTVAVIHLKWHFHPSRGWLDCFPLHLVDHGDLVVDFLMVDWGRSGDWGHGLARYCFNSAKN